MSARTAMAPTCAAVSAVLRDPPAVDLAGPTPCTDFDLRSLVEHAVGTTGAMARAGLGEPLDPDDPWGGGTGAAEGDWSTTLRTNLDAIARGWGTEDAWDGTVEAGSSSMPAAMIGDMALVEVALHGWDLARSLGRELDVPDEAAVEVLRVATETAEMGRSMGAYGAPVAVPDDAPALDRALGAAGRDPGWHR